VYSSASGGRRVQQCLHSVPENLHADADEEKRGEPQNDAHAAFADNGSETIGETVAKKNAQRRRALSR